MQTIRLALLDMKPGARVLDLGCGKGRHVHAVAAEREAFVVGLDLAEADVRAARSDLDALRVSVPLPGTAGFLAGDALRLPFSDGAFDIVICSEVLEHIPDYKSAIGEIVRVLKPGGTLGVSVPRQYPEAICWALAREYHETPGGHVRIFRTRQLRADVEGAGLVFARRHWAHGLHSPYWWLQCLIWKSRERNPLVKLYHKLLVWDIMQRPKLLRRIEESVLDPLMGKSVVLYFAKRGAA